MDTDGSFTFSRVQLLNLNTNNNFVVSPNPAKSMVTIVGKNISSVAVFGMAGNQLLAQESINSTSVQLNISRLAAGRYIVRIKDMNGVVEIKNLVVQ